VAEMHARLEAAGESALPTPGQRVGQLPADMELSVGPDPEVVAHTPELRKKFRQLEVSANPTVRLAIETIKYFSLFVPIKMARALSQVAANGPGDQQSDANGSGKAALLALERMERAWQSLIDNHHMSTSVVAPFLAEIARMQRNINRALPDARRFIRPGFDEPDEVKMLDAARC